MTTNGALTKLVDFTGANGAEPFAALTQGSDGIFYGTTYGGSSGDNGTLFRMTPNGTLTMLVDFTGANGAMPWAGLTLGNDRDLYGTTEYGGSSGLGTVFSVTTNGTLTTLVVFKGTNGARPMAALTLGNDGNFYGTTVYGGSNDLGTLFRMTPNGTLTKLVDFTGINGARPWARLTLGNDGYFYGTTESGGSSGCGTIFRVTTNGTLTMLVDLKITNVAWPKAALTLGNDGNFYGTDVHGAGIVFRLLLSPVITLQPLNRTNILGATTTFTVNNTGTEPLSYQWQKNGTNLVDGENVSGATKSTLTITSILNSDAAYYSVIVSNYYGAVTSSNAALTVINPPIMTTQPLNLLALSGTNVAFGVLVNGTTPFRYQWQFNGANIVNATNAIYTIQSVHTNNAGDYSVLVTNAAGSATSSNASLSVVLSPKSQNSYAGSTVTFAAAAFGPGSLNYQWQKNGTNLVDVGNISGGTKSTLTIAGVSDADAANYCGVVSDAYSSVTTSNATLTVNNMPFIASQPQNQAVLVGSNVTFTVTVYGAPPFVFQWYYKGSPIGSPVSGGGFSTYTLTNLRTNQAGNYSVQIVNGYGSVMSANASLTVIVPPTLTLQLSAGYPLLRLNGKLGKNYVVQYSDNLADTNWINLLSLTNLSVNPYQFLDPAGASQSARYYRALMQ